MADGRDKRSKPFSLDRNGFRLFWILYNFCLFVCVFLRGILTFLLRPWHLTPNSGKGPAPPFTEGFQRTGKATAVPALPVRFRGAGPRKDPLSRHSRRPTLSAPSRKGPRGGMPSVTSALVPGLALGVGFGPPVLGKCGKPGGGPSSTAAAPHRPNTKAQPGAASVESRASASRGGGARPGPSAADVPSRSPVYRLPLRPSLVSVHSGAAPRQRGPSRGRAERYGQEESAPREADPGGAQGGRDRCGKRGGAR